MFSEKSWGSIFKWKIFLRWVVPIMMSNKHAICLICLKKMISYAFFLFHAMGMSVSSFVRDKLQLYSFEVYLIWIVYYTSRLFFVFFLLVLTRVAHPKLCFAQKPLLYPNRAQINEENKQPNISKKRGYKINHCIFCFTCVFSFKLTSFCMSDFRISSSKYPYSQPKDKSQASSKEGWRL